MLIEERSVLLFYQDYRQPALILPCFQKCGLIYYNYSSLKMVNYCFVIPILEGLVELVKEFSRENTHTTEHDEFYQIAGVSREQAWIQLSPTISGMPDFEVISMETKDPAHMFKEFGTSSSFCLIQFTNTDAIKSILNKAIFYSYDTYLNARFTTSRYFRRMALVVILVTVTGNCFSVSIP